MRLVAREELKAPALADLARLDDPAFRALFAKNPVKRIGRDRFIRNVLYAIGNSGNLDLAPVAQDHLSDPSPLVRGAAVWALSRLMEPAAFAELRTRTVESDPEVLAEWTRPNSSSAGQPKADRGDPS